MWAARLRFRQWALVRKSSVPLCEDLTTAAAGTLQAGTFVLASGREGTHVSSNVQICCNQY